MKSNVIIYVYQFNYTITVFKGYYIYGNRKKLIFDMEMERVEKINKD